MFLRSHLPLTLGVGCGVCQVTATLYRDTSKGSPPVFQRKRVVFLLHETQSPTLPSPTGPPLARVVLDLADFGEREETTRRTLLVATSRQVATSLGAPALTISVRQTGKKIAQRVPRSRQSNYGGADRQGWGGMVGGGDDDCPKTEVATTLSR